MRRLSDLLARPAGAPAYHVPNADELARAETLFLDALMGHRGEELNVGFAKLGFAVESMKQGGVGLLTISEPTDRVTGKGTYVFRSPMALPIALQAPHRFKDLHTAELAFMLLEEAPFSAAAWNSVPRWFERDGRKFDADLAHMEPTYFNAFTRAFGRAFPDGLVTQLHGFSHQKRKTSAGRSAEVIVSGASLHPDESVRLHHGCLAEKFGSGVMLYPEQVLELGGTTDTNAAALRELRAGRFLHLELSLSVRRKLMGDPEARRLFATCLTDRPELNFVRGGRSRKLPD